MRTECLTLETEGNLALVPTMAPGLVPSLNPDSNINEAIEAFLSSQIPKKTTARGYRRHLHQAFEMMGVEHPIQLQAVHLVNMTSAS